MIAKKRPSAMDLFRSHFKQILNHRHPLFRLAGEIDWSVFEKEFGPTYSEVMGRPAKPIRLLVGLHYLKHAFNESDESVVDRWVENPYWQYFCGFEYFHHEFPLEPTTLVKWRKRVGPEKLESLLAETIETAKRQKLLKKRELDRVNVDTTVQEKNIAFPTDARLYHHAREVLVREAKKRGITLRQTFKRKSKAALHRQNRLRHARQGKKANRELKQIKTYLGRVVRDLIRKADPSDEAMKELMLRAAQLLTQTRQSKDKLYSMEAPEVECISKGKAHKRYEFGVKVGIVSTSVGNWVIGAQAFHGKPYDGHTLKASLEQMERITGREAKHAYCDKGYRGHGYEGETEVHIPGRGKRKRTRAERKWMRRRSAVEPVIGHVKHDNRMIRNFLKGVEGDQMNPILAAAGYNMRKMLAAFADLFLRLFGCACRLVLAASRKDYSPHHPPIHAANTA
jgi:IS5 family transposase